MGGLGSGRSWCDGANETTCHYHSIDVRRWHREELLIQHQSFSWMWTRHGEKTASINVKSEEGRVIIRYRCYVVPSMRESESQ